MSKGVVAESLQLEDAVCCICGETDASVPIAVGEDFEYRTSPDTFVMYRCERCQVIYLDPRPARSELGRIYGPDYHAYTFNEDAFGLSYRVRSRLETRRILEWCGGLPPGARIIDIGAGDGFHLKLLRQAGDPTWKLEAVEPDGKAAEAAAATGLIVHRSFIEDLELEPRSYDFAIMIMTLEHVDFPLEVLKRAHDLLRPGGRLGIVTDNTAAPDASLGRSRHWGGYHFPRHFYLFNRKSLSELACRAGFEVDRMGTMMSPVNWTYTVHNVLDDLGAPRWLVERFTLRSAPALAIFSLVDTLAGLFGRRALLRAVLRRPLEPM
jgi:SAM-dependent methyltransferase